VSMQIENPEHRGIPASLKANQRADADLQC
jgi:hypothetical protein